MVCLVKGTAFLFLAVVAACTATECSDPSTADPDPYVPRPKVPQQTIKISEPARAIVPIHIETKDYCGPYDPFDPKGLGAAHRRELKMKGEKVLEEVKSYYPKGLDKFLKKEAIKLALDEGRRFAFAHPRETAMIVDVALKAKRLYNTAKDKVDKECPKEEGSDKDKKC